MPEKSNIILICGTYEQAGYLQTDIARASLERFGGRPLGDGSGRWQLQDGTIVQFTVISDDIRSVLHQAEQAAHVYLLFDPSQLPDETAWYYPQFYAQLRHLQETRHMNVTVLTDGPSQLSQDLSRHVAPYVPIDLMETQPQLPTPPKRDK